MPDGEPGRIPGQASRVIVADRVLVQAGGSIASGRLLAAARAMGGSKSWHFADLDRGTCVCWSGTDDSPDVSRDSPLVWIVGTPIAHSGSIAPLDAAGEWERDAAAPATWAGTFVALKWLPAEQRLVVATDAYGVEPLYRTLAPTTLIASEAKALGGHGLDWEQLGVLVVHQSLMGQATTLKDLERVSPGAQGEHVAGDTGWTWRVRELRWPEQESMDGDTAVSLVREALRREITTYWKPGSTLMLSGGYDSRLYLGVMAELGLKPLCVTHEHLDEENGLDSRLARAVCRKLGMPLTVVPDERDFFPRGRAIDVALACDGMYLPLALFAARWADSHPPSDVTFSAMASGNVLSVSATRYVGRPACERMGEIFALPGSITGAVPEGVEHALRRGGAAAAAPFQCMADRTRATAAYYAIRLRLRQCVLERRGMDGVGIVADGAHPRLLGELFRIPRRLIDGNGVYDRLYGGPYRSLTGPGFISASVFMPSSWLAKVRWGRKASLCPEEQRATPMEILKPFVEHAAAEGWLTHEGLKRALDPGEGWAVRFAAAAFCLAAEVNRMGLAGEWRRES